MPGKSNYVKKRATIKRSIGRKYAITRPVRTVMRYAGVPVAARLHVFKRMGDPLVMKNNGVAVVPALSSNAAGTGTGPGSFPLLQVGNAATGFVNSTTQFGGAFSFNLAQLSSYQELTNLFDNYRIKAVKLRFDYSYNAAPGTMGVAGGAAAYAVPLLHITPDYDDNMIPADRGTVMQNGYSKSIRLDRSFTMTLTPRIQGAIAGGAVIPGSTTAAGGLMPIGTWLDTNSTTVPHFGVKFWIDDWNDGGNTAALVVTPTFIIEGRNVV